jgi:hypothetical protein
MLENVNHLSNKWKDCNNLVVPEQGEACEYDKSLVNKSITWLSHCIHKADTSKTVEDGATTLFALLFPMFNVGTKNVVQNINVPEIFFNYAFGIETLWDVTAPVKSTEILYADRKIIELTFQDDYMTNDKLKTSIPGALDMITEVETTLLTKISELLGTSSGTSSTGTTTTNEEPVVTNDPTAPPEEEPLEEEPEEPLEEEPEEVPPEEEPESFRRMPTRRIYEKFKFAPLTAANYDFLDVIKYGFISTCYYKLLELVILSKNADVKWAIVSALMNCKFGFTKLVEAIGSSNLDILIPTVIQESFHNANFKTAFSGINDDNISQSELAAIRREGRSHSNMFKRRKRATKADMKQEVRKSRMMEYINRTRKGVCNILSCLKFQLAKMKAPRFEAFSHTKPLTQTTYDKMMSILGDLSAIKNITMDTEPYLQFKYTSVEDIYNCAVSYMMSLVLYSVSANDPKLVDSIYVKTLSVIAERKVFYDDVVAIFVSNMYMNMDIIVNEREKLLKILEAKYRALRSLYLGGNPEDLDQPIKIIKDKFLTAVFSDTKIETPANWLPIPDIIVDDKNMFNISIKQIDVTTDVTDYAFGWNSLKSSKEMCDKCDDYYVTTTGDSTSIDVQVIPSTSSSVSTSITTSSSSSSSASTSSGGISTTMIIIIIVIVLLILLNIGIVLFVYFNNKKKDEDAQLAPPPEEAPLEPTEEIPEQEGEPTEEIGEETGEGEPVGDVAPVEPPIPEPTPEPSTPAPAPPDTEPATRKITIEI